MVPIIIILNHRGGKNVWDSVSTFVCVSCSVMFDSCDSWTGVHQAPLSIEFSRQEYWNGLLFPSPGDLPNPGIEPRSSVLQADRFFTVWATREVPPVRMAIIKRSTDKKCRRGCGEKGTLLHCWWESKLVQPLWKTVWKFLTKLKIELLYDPAIPFLDKTITQKDTHAPMFIAALFTIAKICCCCCCC